MCPVDALLPSASPEEPLPLSVRTALDLTSMTSGKVDVEAALQPLLPRFEAVALLVPSRTATAAQRTEFASLAAKLSALRRAGRVAGAARGKRDAYLLPPCALARQQAQRFAPHAPLPPEPWLCALLFKTAPPPAALPAAPMPAATAAAAHAAASAAAVSPLAGLRGFGFSSDDEDDPPAAQAAPPAAPAAPPAAPPDRTVEEQHWQRELAAMRHIAPPPPPPPTPGYDADLARLRAKAAAVTGEFDAACAKRPLSEDELSRTVLLRPPLPAALLAGGASGAFAMRAFFGLVFRQIGAGYPPERLRGAGGAPGGAAAPSGIC